MSSRRVFQPVVSLAVAGLLSSCGYVHVGRVPASTSVAVIGDTELTKENSDLRLEKKLLQQELALTRAQGDALRRALENRAADGDTSRQLTERLQETSRELATLRTEYTQLQRDRDEAVASAAESNSLRARLVQAEDRLAISEQTAGELHREIAQLRADVVRTRTENIALSEQVKTLTRQNDEALAALAQLNTDLLTQKDARLRAEHDAETLRTHVASISPDASVLGQLRTGSASEARSLAAEHAAEIQALKQQLDASRAHLSSLSAERAQLEEHLSALQAADAATAQSNTRLRGENEALKATSAQLLAAKAELETQLARLKNGSSAQQVQVLREQLNSAQAEAASMAEANARLKSRVASTRDAAVEPVRVTLDAGSSSAEPEGPQPVANADTLPEPAADTPKLGGVTATLVARAPGSLRTPAPRIELPGIGRVHVVAGGDTLSKISARYYGTPSRWSDIVAANRDILGETKTLVIGRTLRIP